LDNSRQQLEKTQKKANKKHTSITNAINRYIDIRVQSKIINIIANTLLEYSFYSISYTEDEIDKLEKRNQKQMMKISQRCPSSLLYILMENERIGLKNL
jgi:hypothetical protein